MNVVGRTAKISRTFSVGGGRLGEVPTLGLRSGMKSHRHEGALVRNFQVRSMNILI